MPFTHNVSNARELAAALANANGGDSIVLRAGQYGALDLKGVSFAGNVAITSETPRGAQFSSITLADVDHITFNGVAVEGQFRAWKGSEAVSLLNSDVDGGAYFKEVADIALKGNDISGGIHTLILNDVERVKVVANKIHDAQSDLVRITGDSEHVRIAYNHILDTHALPGDHPDLIQLIGIHGPTPSNVTIKRNVLYDDPATGSTFAQGVFASDPGPQGYRNILVADNLVNVGSPNGIYINGGTHNVLVQGNVLPVWPNGGGGTIRVVEKSGLSNGGTSIEHNVVRQLLDETTRLSDGLKIADTTFKSIPMAELLSSWDAHVDASFAAVPHGLSMDDLSG